jgi:hypothetical protein
VEACAFRGACAGRRAVGDTAFSVSDQRSCCLRRANHQDVVMAFHLAGGEYWSVGREPDDIGDNAFCHSGTDGAG